MEQTQVKSVRNQSIECARLIAAFFVVFIHCNFPGMLGGYVDNIGQLAVPMFMAISGYFCFQGSSELIKRRLKEIVKLYLTAVVLYLLWNVFATEIQGGSTVSYLRAAIPEIDEVARFLFMNIPPYVGHLWYLLAMMTVYMVLWVYTSFFGGESVNYRPLYITAVCLLAGNFILGGARSGIEKNTAYDWCRTGWLTGIPMFSVGLFLREHQQRILDHFHLTTRKQMILFFAGLVLTLIQWKGGIQTGNLRLGMVVSLVGLMLFLTTHPVVAKPDSRAGKCIARLGLFSTALYIIHLMVIRAYELMLKDTMKILLGSSERWLRPLMVLAISMAAAFVWERLDMRIKKLRKP